MKKKKNSFHKRNIHKIKKMVRVQKFEALKGLKIVLKLVELYPANWVFRNIRIPIPLIFRPFFATLFLFQATTIWLCVSFEWDLNFISGPLCFIFGGFQILIIYFAMLQSKLIIIESTDLLQELVEQRKFFKCLF